MVPVYRATNRAVLTRPKFYCFGAWNRACVSWFYESPTNKTQAMKLFYATVILRPKLLFQVFFSRLKKCFQSSKELLLHRELLSQQAQSSRSFHGGYHAKISSSILTRVASLVSCLRQIYFA